MAHAAPISLEFLQTTWKQETNKPKNAESDEVLF